MARNNINEITTTPVVVARQSRWYYNIRKLGHIPEYLALGITTALAWYVTGPRLAYGKAFLLCAMVSLSDQILKGLLPTREFDFVGYAVGIMVVMIGIRVLRRKAFTVEK